MRALFRSAFPGVALYPAPRGGGKAGRLSGDSPCATTHSLLRLPAKHRPTQRTGNARSVCSTTERVFSVCLPQHVLERVVSGLTGTGASLPHAGACGSKRLDWVRKNRRENAFVRQRFPVMVPSLERVCCQSSSPLQRSYPRISARRRRNPARYFTYCPGSRI